MSMLKKKKENTDIEGQQQISPRPEKGTKAEKKWIKQERKKLHTDLKAKGIKSYADFEMIARDLDLTVNAGKLAGVLSGLRYLKHVAFAKLGLGSLLVASASLLTAIFLVAAITEEAGSFTVNLTADMLRAGFMLSESKSFDREESRLFSEEIEEVNNITVTDVDEVVGTVDGVHNGRNYIAYTFYIKNVGEQTASYAYYINLEKQTMNVGDAVWMMLFEDDRQIIYAMPSEDGNPEELYGFKEAPFGDRAYDFDKQYYEEDGKYGLITTPFADESTVVQGVVEDVEVGEQHKYTVVIWVEGYDPQCTNEIFGGYAKYSMDFERVSEEKTDSIFNGIYRTEYEDYNPIKEEEEKEKTTAKN